jgi:hypothetical protein
MIIDIAYIKTVLNTEVNDSVINYLIKHFFNYVCKQTQLDTTLENEEILTTNQTNPTTPNILEDDITLFQETIIYGIGCDLTQTEQLTETNFQIQEKYKDIIQDPTYCNIFDYCLTQLNEYLDSTSQIQYIRNLFSLDINTVSDDELAFLIQHYTNYLTMYLDKDGEEIDTESPLFKQALYSQIACHIYKVNPTAIITPKSYKVDEVRETYVLDFDKEGHTWCDIADEDLANLKKKYYGLYGIYAYDRPGARTKYGYHGPGGNS